MRYIDFTEPKDDPLWQRWRDECDAATRKLIARYEGQEIGHPEAAVDTNPALYARRSIKRKYYCDPKHGPFAPFYGKCVYCEVAKETLAIEHFRPKGSTRDADNRAIVRSKTDDATEHHRGYYWLTYDWRNLLLACDDCNGPRRKGERFPVEDEASRAWASSDHLAAEQPLLINPLAEDPSPHLHVDIETGLISGKDPRGIACEQIFGLNREPLPELRRDTVMRIRHFWNQLLASDSTSEERRTARDYIEQSWKGRYGFTLTARTILGTLWRLARR